MKRLVECVPNVSEGRDRATIDAIADAIRRTPGCTLLDVDAGRSTNRTVYTFVGDPESVVEGALGAARVARERVDMRTHRGEHARLGALDVCPFVPVSGVGMDDCVRCAREFGRRLADELGVPVYLYEAAAEQDYRRTLRQIRAGEYEGLAEKIRCQEWRPDFGPAELVPTWGATVTGARRFLIAYNVNVLGTKEQAHRIALDLREHGRGPQQPGRLRAVKATGWWVEEYGMAQVSMNLEDFEVTPPHVAFEEATREARALKVGVAGSELVGLIPLRALLMAADHYIAAEGLFVLDERQKIRLAVDRLGLGTLHAFDPDKRVIEYMVADAAEAPLASMSVRAFVEEVGARTPAPGGGSVSALVAALGAALGTMVGWMTYGKRKFEDKDAAMRQGMPPLHHAMRELVPLIDADTRAFEAYMSARALPADTDEQARRRSEATENALKKAVEVPLAVLRLGDGCWDAMAEMARHGNVASRSDLEVGAKALETGVWGAYRNVVINLPGIADQAFRDATLAEAKSLAERARQRLQDVLAILEGR
ncbi:MAG TPA: glutamate formimidoyltransferase [Vicinamibacteria bacterium]|nr:glutamate formimidoyltransferase [Vicinamibacteria bacterium]